MSFSLERSSHWQLEWNLRTTELLVNNYLLDIILHDYFLILHEQDHLICVKFI